MATNKSLDLVHLAAGSEVALQDTIQQARDAIVGVVGLERAVLALNEAEWASAAVKHALAACQREVERFREPTVKSSEVVARVFHKLPEVLVLIFSHLSVPDLLSACQLTKSAEGVVRDYKILRQKMGLQPMDDGHFYAPFAHKTKGSQDLVNCRVEPIVSSDGTIESVHFELSFPRGLPKIGSRCRQILVCQPAIKEMQAEVECCSGYAANKSWAIAVPPLKVENNITLGDVYDAAEKLIATHRMCLNASPEQMDSDGFVCVAPSFSAIIALQKNDPMLVRLREIKEHEDLQVAGLSSKLYGGSEKEWDDLTDYAAAKCTAHRTGRRIPTLAEFKAKACPVRGSEGTA